MHLLFNPVWKLASITLQCLLGLTSCYLLQNRTKKGRSFLVSNDSGLLVFETPKELVALDAISLGIAVCTVELFFWMAPTAGRWQVWASLALAVFVLVGILIGVHGPKRIEIDTQTAKYRRHSGWVKRVKTGKNTDITGVIVEVDKPQGRIECELRWAIGRSTTIGLWPYDVETKQKAEALAELVRQAINLTD